MSWARHHDAGSTTVRQGVVAAPFNNAMFILKQPLNMVPTIDRSFSMVTCFGKSCGYRPHRHYHAAQGCQSIKIEENGASQPLIL